MKDFRYYPVTLGAIRTYTPVILARQVNQSLLIPAFSASLEPWPGASRIFALCQLVLPGTAFSIRSGQRFNYTNFFVCVKWSVGSVVYRYKLWNPAGALLSYPVYAGEIIPATGAELEFWSTSASTAPSIPQFNIVTDILEAPAFAGDQDGTELANGICTIGSPATLDAYFYQCRS